MEEVNIEIDDYDKIQDLIWHKLVIFIIKEGMRRLPDKSSVFQAKLIAIQMAMIDLAGILNEEDQYNFFF